MRLYDIAHIKDTLPHRYPFLLVDKIIEFVPGKKAVGIKKVTVNEECVARSNAQKHGGPCSAGG